MSITSLYFILFIYAVLILYYIVPKKLQWCILLAASLFFYLSVSGIGILFLLFNALSVYFATLSIQKHSDSQKEYISSHKELSREERNTFRDSTQRKRCHILITALILNILAFSVFKYSRTVLSFFGQQSDADFTLPAVLGISYYTLQSIGYLIDVYYESVQPQKNFFKLLLFISFFPHITQGPIADYKKLSDELFSAHSFSSDSYILGGERVIAGYVKKIVIADMLAPVVSDIFLHHTDYSGMTVLFGILLNAFRLYADFSGYMDIMCGICEMLGIRLSENFMRPFFAKSVAEFWRRWHITLGEWFKKYVYYPIGISSGMKKLSRSLTAKHDRQFSRNVAATVSLMTVWLLTGLWHGINTGYIAWGLTNGLIITISQWCEPLYEKCRNALRINVSAFYWRVVQCLRTFLIFSFIETLSDTKSISQCFSMWGRVFTDFGGFHGLSALLPAAGVETWVILTVGVGIMFAAGLIGRRMPFRQWFSRIPSFFRIVLLALLCVVILYYGTSDIVEGFLYAQF